MFLDLGNQPLANNYLSKENLDKPEVYYPLRPTECQSCGLVQLEEFEPPENIFRSDYAFRSGQSKTWIDHLHKFAIEMMDELKLDHLSHVCEIASNDGVLLAIWRHLGIPALGVEPAADLAWESTLKGLAVVNNFMTAALGERMAANGYTADLINANNVLCHVPSLDDFLGGIKAVLAPHGTLSIEVPDLQFQTWDQIYSEHFSYVTEPVARDILERRRFEIVRVDPLPTHGGSMRLVARHA